MAWSLRMDGVNTPQKRKFQYFLISSLLFIIVIVMNIDRSHVSETMNSYVPADKWIQIFNLRPTSAPSRYPTLEISSCISSCLLYLDNFSFPMETDSPQSVCGYTASRRGYHQKVVSYSFYGEMKDENRDRDYFPGIATNLEILQDYYPGWVFRLYIDSSKMDLETRQSLCLLNCGNPWFDLCLVNSLPHFGDLSTVFGRTWRFLPMTDPTVDIMVSRDLDSMFTAREEAAVNEWLQSDLPFHIMRDHHQHEWSMLAGMWGARLDSGARERYHIMFRNLFEDAPNFDWYNELDQTLLIKWVWPQIQNDTLVHDSYFCQMYKSDHWRPWPTQRIPGPYNFVGAAGPQEEDWMCPELCRPEDHQDWIIC